MTHTVIRECTYDYESLMRQHKYNNGMPLNTYV